MTLLNGVLNSKKGRGRRQNETLRSINYSCSADDLWIAVVNSLLWHLNQLYYMPAWKAKWPMTPSPVHSDPPCCGEQKTMSRFTNGMLEFARFVWNTFHICWRWRYCKWCTIRHHASAALWRLMMWKEGHSVTGINFVVIVLFFSWGSLRWRNNMQEKWVVARHSAHYVDVEGIWKH